MSCLFIIRKNYKNDSREHRYEAKAIDSKRKWSIRIRGLEKSAKGRSDQFIEWRRNSTRLFFYSRHNVVDRWSKCVRPLLGSFLSFCVSGILLTFPASGLPKDTRSTHVSWRWSLDRLPSWTHRPTSRVGHRRPQTHGKNYDFNPRTRPDKFCRYLGSLSGQIWEIILTFVNIHQFPCPAISSRLALVLRLAHVVHPGRKPGFNFLAGVPNCQRAQSSPLQSQACSSKHQISPHLWLEDQRDPVGQPRGLITDQF